MACPDPPPIRHIAVGLDCPQDRRCRGCYGPSSRPPNYSAYLRNPASARNTTSRQLRLYLNTPIAPLPVGRVRDRMGSLGYSLKRARRQTGLSLLEYPYSLFYSSATQPHIVMGPPHRKKLLSASKSKGPLEAGFRPCTNYVSTHQYPPYRGCSAGAPVSICGLEVQILY